MVVARDVAGQAERVREARQAVGLVVAAVRVGREALRAALQVVAPARALELLLKGRKRQYLLRRQSRPERDAGYC